MQNLKMRIGPLPMRSHVTSMMTDVDKTASLHDWTDIEPMRGTPQTKYAAAIG